MGQENPAEENRKSWDAASDEYQQRHGSHLRRLPLAWGTWRIAEAELRILGDVQSQDILELGCGAAQWTLELEQHGAHSVGIDISSQQLRHAQPFMTPASALVQGDAQQLPFADEAFDIVFCDHGAMSFAPPQQTVPEAARVLRAGGLFAFCMSTPLRDICWDQTSRSVTSRLAIDYFGLGEILDDADPTVCFQLPYGEWIRLFRRHSLIVEGLVELQAPPQTYTTYDDYVSWEWARRWPAEQIWRLRKT